MIVFTININKGCIVKIFDSYKINNLKLRNRLVMAPMTTWSGEKDGSLSRSELAYYKKRSQGVGMVITATTYTVPHGKGFSGQFYAGEDRMINSLKSLSSVIKEGGAKAILQVFHAGRKANPADMPDGMSRSASNVPGNREEDNKPARMTEEEINTLIKSFYDVTLRAHQAGFDGIEIHGANTYLLQQFFSPHANRRDDDWGGDIEKRKRLPIAIIEACQKARKQINDPNFIIGYRFSPEENHTPGITLEDTKYLVNELCSTEIDYLHISLGDYNQKSVRDEGIHLIKEIIKTVNQRKPFIGVGSVLKKVDADKLLALGVDLVAIGRQLIVDPNTIEKWEKGLTPYELYDPNDDKRCVPKSLNQVIIDSDGWIPM